MTPADILAIRLLQGEVSAVEVAKLFHRSPETIRRLWRGETHRGVGGQPPSSSFAAEASLGHLMEALNAPKQADQTTERTEALE